MTFAIAGGVEVEPVEDGWLVLRPGSTGVLHVVGREAAALALARDGATAVPIGLQSAMAGLVELGVVATDAWSRRRVIQLGGVAAAAAVSVVALPGVAAAASPSQTTRGTLPAPTFAAVAHLVGGGGGGGDLGGGGGAGGVVTTPFLALPVGIHFVDVGAGGGLAQNGQPSSFAGHQAGGGGTGAGVGNNPAGDGGVQGGSGGGAMGSHLPGTGDGAGHDGAPSDAGDGGGGGGAGSAGSGRDGGTGVQLSLPAALGVGSPVGWFGGGGGGGYIGAGTSGLGGTGGGADGGSDTPAAANTGGGGGGTTNSNDVPTGGSGIVIIEAVQGQPFSISGDGTHSTEGGIDYWVFRSDGDFIIT